MERWRPVRRANGMKEFPDDKENVQVTYIGYHDRKPYCDAFAYRSSGRWYWALDDSDVGVEIVAWKKNCEPYIPNKDK